MLARPSASARSAVDFRPRHAAAAPLTTDPRSTHSVAAPRRATDGHHAPPAPRPGTARSSGRHRCATTPTSSGDRRAARPPASSPRCRRRGARTGLSRAQPDGAREATVTGGQRGGRTPARPDPPASPGVGRPGNPTSTSHARSADRYPSRGPSPLVDCPSVVLGPGVTYPKSRLWWGARPATQVS